MANSPLRKILPFQRDFLSVMVVGLQSEIPQFKAIQNEEGESNISVCPFAVMEKQGLLSLFLFLFLCLVCTQIPVRIWVLLC